MHMGSLRTQGQSGGRRSALVAVGTVMISALLAALAPVAHSETVRLQDARGDAYQRTMDITAVRITNGSHRVTVVAHFEDLRGGDHGTFGATLDPAGEGDIYSVSGRRAAGGGLDASLGEGSSLSEMHSSACDVHGFWSLRRDTVRLSFPRRCIIENGSLRVRFATSVIADAVGDANDWTRELRVRQN